MSKKSDLPTLRVVCPGCRLCWTGDPRGTRVRESWCESCAPSCLDIPYPKPAK